MGLTQYIAAFITFVNNLVIPFLLGIAFLVFIINVIRFFVFGGTNVDSKEKAKSLAVYGILGFVLILVFWGIINLLTNSLGLQALGERTARCPDYNPDCNITPAQQTGGGSNVGGDFGFGTGNGDDFAPIGVNTDGFGNEIVPETGLPSTPPTDTPPDTSNPTQLQAPQLEAGFNSVSSISTQSEEVIRTALAPVLPVVDNHLPAVENDLLEIEMHNIARDSISDTQRMQMLRSFDQAGIIEQGSFFAAADNVNDVYEANNGDRVSLAIEDMSGYTDAIMRYAQAVENDVNRSNAYAVSIGLSDQSQLAVTANDLYSYPESNSLETNVENAYRKYNLLTGTQSGLSDREDFLNDFITATNVYIERSGDNGGTPITRADILGN